MDARRQPLCQLLVSGGDGGRLDLGAAGRWRRRPIVRAVRNRGVVRGVIRGKEGILLRAGHGVEHSQGWAKLIRSNG
ncbi:hypothetical protein CATMQ487_24330 [Sphaerotilus microaerophilus]|uniref:Uncharacterized protein n=1 Tax=Sphaerotilus microaerophilus TaxID=2914710 RepID=A0ABN6PN84_9BURK|nr:hypothetical protein CATMQ487_24330 [Sphaerotilus sp. FB-5]